MPIREIQIELTNACQASCLMCNHKIMKRPITHMDLDLLRKIVAEAATIIQPPYLLGICGIGEPILHPQFNECLQIIRQIPFSLGTNCMAFDDATQELVIEAKFTDITLSLDAMTAETHAKMRPGLDFKTCMENATRFISRLNGRPRFWRNIFVQFIPTPANIHEMKPFIDRWLPRVRSIGAQVFIKPMCKWPGCDNPYYPAPKPEIIVDKNILYGPFEEVMKFRESCQLFDNYVGIQSDGNYQPCCMPVENDYQIGNVKDATIEQLYGSAQMASYRKSFREKRYYEIPFCKNCV